MRGARTLKLEELGKGLGERQDCRPASRRTKGWASDDDDGKGDDGEHSKSRRGDDDNEGEDAVGGESRVNKYFWRRGLPRVPTLKLNTNS